MNSSSFGDTVSSAPVSISFISSVPVADFSSTISDSAMAPAYVMPISASMGTFWRRLRNTTNSSAPSSVNDSDIR